LHDALPIYSSCTWPSRPAALMVEDRHEPDRSQLERHLYAAFPLLFVTYMGTAHSAQTATPDSSRACLRRAGPGVFPGPRLSLSRSIARVPASMTGSNACSGVPSVSRITCPSWMIRPASASLVSRARSTDGVHTPRSRPSVSRPANRARL